ncbi:hypothetical protein DINM_004002 [Dirofilaria immitis]|nr:hypothetical protein [Dirofilaria immitis]
MTKVFEEAQPELTEPFDFLKLGEEQEEALNLSMEVNEKDTEPLDLSTEVLDLSRPKVNVKRQDQCNISVQKAKNEPTKLNMVMNDEHREPLNLSIQEEAQPQWIEPLDLIKRHEEQTEPLDLSAMKMNEEQTETLDLSEMEMKVNIKEAEDQCNISIQKAEDVPTKLNDVMNDGHRELLNLSIQEEDEEGKKRTGKRKTERKKKNVKTCDICGKELRSNFIRHMKTHNNEKPYSCSYCQKNFTRKANLDMHMLTHTGVKPHSCLICGKSFTQKEYLEAHIRIHTGERPYNCLECERNFTRKKNLRRHIRIHHGFYSKDLIIEHAYSIDSFAFVMSLVVAFFTAFYSWRVLLLVFHSQKQSKIDIYEVPIVMLIPLFILLGRYFLGYGD